MCRMVTAATRPFHALADPPTPFSVRIAAPSNGPRNGKGHTPVAAASTRRVPEFPPDAWEEPRQIGLRPARAVRATRDAGRARGQVLAGDTLVGLHRDE